jgi:cell division control protein 6
VVLDEVDLMSRKDKRREILYLLSRSEQPYMVIMLANSPQVLKQLDQATRSSLQPLPMHFRNYNAEQLHEILRDRAQRGLRKWEDGQLAEIAALTTQLATADARVAIKTLHYAVLEAKETVAACFEAARRDLVLDLIHDLTGGLLLILWAAAMSRSGLAKEIYKRYCRLSQQYREKPFSYTHFYSHLGYMQSVGLIVLSTTKVDRVYTNRAKLMFDESIVDSIARLRFEQG